MCNLSAMVYIAPISAQFYISRAEHTTLTQNIKCAVQNIWPFCFIFSSLFFALSFSSNFMWLWKIPFSVHKFNCTLAHLF